MFRHFWSFGAALCLAAGLSACVSAGRESAGFIEPRLMGAYIPLSSSKFGLFNNWGAAFTIAPNIAVTNDHNMNFIPAGAILARSRDFDLLFFRQTGGTPALTGRPRAGEEVIAYGQGAADDLREARGVVTGLDEYVPPRCSGCTAQRALVFEAAAGGGFSGGPVVDARTGAVLGITFGYLDNTDGVRGRRMYAYDIELVISEMRRLLPNPTR